jgi:MOSC domain-containing protein YiiM
MTDGAARVISVNLVYGLHPDPNGSVGRTAIDKRAVDGPVKLIDQGPEGDAVMDRENHGGVDQAVYAYAAEDLVGWGEELHRDLRPGMFGENLTTEGIDVTNSVIGTIWAVGDTRLQVRCPRIPCNTFKDWMEEPQWVRRFTEHGAPGAYLKVLTSGEVQAGDAITIESAPDHGVTIGDLFAGRRGDRAKLELLIEQPDIAEKVVRYVQRELAVGTGATTQVGSA